MQNVIDIEVVADRAVEHGSLSNLGGSFCGGFCGSFCRSFGRGCCRLGRSLGGGLCRSLGREIIGLSQIDGPLIPVVVAVPVRTEVDIIVAVSGDVIIHVLTGGIPSAEVIYDLQLIACAQYDVSELVFAVGSVLIEQ